MLKICAFIVPFRLKNLRLSVFLSIADDRRYYRLLIAGIRGRIYIGTSKLGMCPHNQWPPRISFCSNSFTSKNYFTSSFYYLHQGGCVFTLFVCSLVSRISQNSRPHYVRVRVGVGLGLRLTFHVTADRTVAVR